MHPPGPHIGYTGEVYMYNGIPSRKPTAILTVSSPIGGRGMIQEAQTARHQIPFSSTPAGGPCKHHLPRRGERSWLTRRVEHLKPVASWRCSQTGALLCGPETTRRELLLWRGKLHLQMLVARSSSSRKKNQQLMREMQG